MNTVTVLVVAISLFMIANAAHKGHGKCLPGDKHKESPYRKMKCSPKNATMSDKYWDKELGQLLVIILFAKILRC